MEVERLVQLKCQFEHQLKRMSVAASISWPDFVRHLEDEYKCPLQIDLETEDGSRVPLDSPSALSSAIAQYESSRSGPLLLVLKRRSTTSPEVKAAPNDELRNVKNLQIDVDLVNAAVSSASRPNDMLVFMQNLQADLSSDDFEIVGTIGSGNFGTVFAAIHVSQQKLVALKRMRANVRSAEQKQILTELEVLHQSRSGDIIGYYGSFFQGDTIHLCMEFMDCGSLASVSHAAGRVPELLISRIAASVLRGIAYLFSELRILHRDIKPSNILLNSRGDIKLCDFGVSGKLSQFHDAASFTGSVAYMSPERVNGVPYAIRSDVWAVGITMLEAATGRPAYDGNDIAGDLDLMHAIVKKPSPKPTRNGDFTDDFCDFIEACLIKDEKARPVPEDLLAHPFIVKGAQASVDVGAWTSQYRLKSFVQYEAFL